MSPEPKKQQLRGSVGMRTSAVTANGLAHVYENIYMPTIFSDLKVIHLSIHSSSKPTQFLFGLLEPIPAIVEQREGTRWMDYWDHIDSKDGV